MKEKTKWILASIGIILISITLVFGGILIFDKTTSTQNATVAITESANLLESGAGRWSSTVKINNDWEAAIPVNLTEQEEKEEEPQVETVEVKEEEVIEQVEEEKTIDELVEEVEKGIAGNGEARKEYLGDKYDEVMAIINERYKIQKQESTNVQSAAAASTNTTTIATNTSATKQEYQQYAYSLFGNYGWSEYDYQCLISLWEKESGWNSYSKNSSSGAYGIPQALPGSKMASAGSDWETNYQTQIKWGLSYIQGRYGSPSNAWSHFQSKGWY